VTDAELIAEVNRIIAHCSHRRDHRAGACHACVEWANAVWRAAKPKESVLPVPPVEET